MMDVTNEVIAREFEVGPGCELSLSAMEGDVQIHGGPDSRIAVRATSPDGDLEPEDIRFNSDGRRVEVRTKVGPGGSFPIDYDITVPRDCALSIDAVQSDVTVRGISGNGSIRTANGDVALDGLRGSWKVNGANSDVRCRDIDGDLTIRTPSGDVSVRSSRLHNLDVECTSGDIIMESSLAQNGAYRMHTFSGDVILLLAPDDRASIAFDTQGGELDARMTVEVTASTRRHRRLTLNGGEGASIQVTTVNGDLQIGPAEGRRASSTCGEARPDPEPATAEAAPAEPVPPATAIDVLEALARGEISIDDAMAQLDGEMR